MANATRNAILRALIEGVLTDLMVKTNSDNVYLQDGTTTLSAKLAEIIAALNAKATTASVNEAVNALRQELLGDVPVEAYNTFTELAAYIETHQDAADALTAAIGTKANQSAVDDILATLNSLGALAKKSAVSESDLDSALKEKVNAASEGNHSHNNKALLDTYTQTEVNLKDAVIKRHAHSNKDVLDGITEEQVTGWDNKGTVFTQPTQPASMTASDLWLQIF